MTKHTYLQVIDTIYLFSGTGCRCDSVTIGERLGLSPQVIESSLKHLESKGLVDREQVRLSLTGLALGAALQTERRQAVTHRAA